MKVTDLVDQVVREIHKCYKIAKQKHNSVCTTRSQLVYLVLKDNGFKPKILRYFTSKKQEKRIKIILISREISESHVVVLLNADILDSNLPRKIPKEKYDEKIGEINKGIRIISDKYDQNINKNELKKICDGCGLSYLFTDALKYLPEE